MSEDKVGIHKRGKTYINTLSPEERNKIRSKCHTLHFVKLLKLASKRADRQIKGGETTVSYKAVGVVLYSDEDISVPDIPGIYTKETGIPPEEIKSRDVKAKEHFTLTYYEYMFLMFRKEYAGFCTRDDDPYGVYFSPKMPKYLQKQAKLPTPTLNFSKQGSPKEIMDEIDYYDMGLKRWRIRPEYAEKFGTYLRDVIPMRPQEGMTDYPQPTKGALGLAQLLNEEYNYKV